LTEEAFVECVPADLLEPAAGVPAPSPYAGPSRTAAAKKPAAPSTASRGGLFGVSETIMVPMYAVF
jgi:hypothetical protein